MTEKIFDSEEEIQANYLKCANPQKLKCFPITGAEMWPCSAARRRKELGFPVDASEYINLLDDTLSIEVLRKKIRSFYARKYFSACAYCSGMRDDSERFIPAEQITVYENECIKAGARSYSEVVRMLEHR